MLFRVRAVTVRHALGIEPVVRRDPDGYVHKGQQYVFSDPVTEYRVCDMGPDESCSLEVAVFASEAQAVALCQKLNRIPPMILRHFSLHELGVC